MPESILYKENLPSISNSTLQYKKQMCALFLKICCGVGQPCANGEKEFLPFKEFKVKRETSIQTFLWPFLVKKETLETEISIFLNLNLLPIGEIKKFIGHTGSQIEGLCFWVEKTKSVT